MLDEIHENDMLSDPYKLYQKMHSEAPLCWRKRSGAWFMTGYDDIVVSLRDRRLSAVNLPKAIAVLPWLKNLDPPDHTRLRKAANRAFAASVPELIEGRVTEIVDDLLEAKASNGYLDIISDLAAPLLNRTIIELLGLPREDQAQFRAFSDAAGAFIGSMSGVDQIARIRTAIRSLKEMRTYMLGLIEERRRRPAKDMLSMLLVYSEQEDVLTDDDILAVCIEIVFAGQETTTNLIGNGFLTLLRHPDQFQLLKWDPLEIKSAVEEILRYESPVQSTPRVALESIEIHGETIKQGQRVVLCIGAANRDPARFPEPDHFDIRRSPNRHIAFGYGIHFCLGASLARVVAQTAFTRVIERLPDLTLAADDVEWLPNPGFRGLKRLPVTFQSAPRLIPFHIHQTRHRPVEPTRDPASDLKVCPVPH